MTSVHHSLDGLLSLSLAVAEHTERGLRERDLSRSEARLLWSLAEAAPARQQRLSELLGVTPRYVTRLVDDLSDRGLVERRPHPSDRRSMLVTPTREGERLLSRMRADHDRLADALFGDMSPDKRATFQEIASGVIERLS
ncbi:MarR family transcriptional regulator [Georgenia halophila]|uniref:MarR family winged helix-turn-helix transcriptional regulator n=1 Tax=Georgenia halophila TaxID=620889 RepID=UPI0031E82D9B